MRLGAYKLSHARKRFHLLEYTFLSCFSIVRHNEDWTIKNNIAEFSESPVVDMKRLVYFAGMGFYSLKIYAALLNWTVSTHWAFRKLMNWQWRTINSKVRYKDLRRFVINPPRLVLLQKLQCFSFSWVLFMMTIIITSLKSSIVATIIIDLYGMQLFKCLEWILKQQGLSATYK